jgi:hypothetical protein
VRREHHGNLGQGQYALKERNEAKLVFEIRGRRLKGDYYLVRLKERGPVIFREKVIFVISQWPSFTVHMTIQAYVSFTRSRVHTLLS